METVFKSTDFKQQCLYCGKQLQDRSWHSEHDANRHYKTTVCDCGKRLSLRVDFWGSGHDNWDQTWKQRTHIDNEKCTIRTIDNLVRCIK